MRVFLQSQQDEALVQLRAPCALDARDYEFSGTAPPVRLARRISSTGQVRVMATNLPTPEFPAAVFGNLYHQRWRIEEAFKRLKHRLKLECVSGLTQQALLVDVAAKVLADNLAELVCMAVQTNHQLQSEDRVCNRTYAAVMMQRWCRVRCWSRRAYKACGHGLPAPWPCRARTWCAACPADPSQGPRGM